MFSGIIEAQSQIVSTSSQPGLVRIVVNRPVDFVDIKTGDSIAVNGICLTVENFDSNKIEFALAAETLRVTGWSENTLRSSKVNLERSLRIGDRVHGHFVSGHVDAMGKVAARRELGASLELDINFPASLKPYIWKKGSWAINGVSLTINEVKENQASICLIPETLERTNLANLQVGQSVTIEVDPMARGLIHVLNTRNETSL
jgi:riboflavin synthase